MSGEGQRLVNPSQLIGGIGPEVEDVAAHDQIGRSKAARRAGVAVEQLQAAARYGLRVAASGAFQHDARWVDSDDSGMRVCGR